MEKKALLLDFDGTFIDSMYVWYDIDCELLVNNGYIPDEEYISKISTVTFDQGIKYIIEKYKLEKTHDELMKEIEELAFKQYNENIPLKPGARDLLIKLKDKGIKIALVTSCRKALCLSLLKKHGVHEYFDEIVFTEDYDMNKNEPYIYQKAASLLGVSANECIIVEDSPHAAEGAKKSGGFVVGVYEKYFNNKQTEMQEICDKYIYDLNEISNLIY